MPTTPDIHIPDSIVISADTFSFVFIRRLLTKLSDIITVDPQQDPAAWAEEWQMLQEFFWALKPTNPVEAVLAAHIVGTQHSGMELTKRAALPGLSNETVHRLRTSATAAGRALLTTLHRLEKRQQQGARAEPEPIAVPLFDAARPTAAPPSPLNGFANRAARRAAAALARKPARLSLNGG
jgi:hypothetical protein